MSRVSLRDGTRLGPYEIVGLLGAGGMGEVYRARDPRLDRTVAIKVLPAIHATAPDRLERFAREARAAASLKHPNILAVYDVGVDTTGPYIVSELLEGETLRQALVPGRPWPVRKALDAAVQIASGLAAAHARGIVHRDLKPDNLFWCDDGVVKILDFGLARLGEQPGGAAGETLTREDTVLGTVGYMAPEQVRGQPVDHRTDIFAFGAVLYELFTGDRAFAGDTAADTITSILTGDPPDLTALERTSRQTARIVTRCLEKRPDARFQSVSDLGFALRSVSSSDMVDAPPRGRAWTFGRKLPTGSLLAGMIALGLLAAAALGLLAGRFVLPVERPVTAPAAHRLTDFVGLEETPAISPDGRSVAFTSGMGGVPQVFVRLISGGNPLQLTHTAQGCQSPRWSADSNSILCFSQASADARLGVVWEVPALGGAPRHVADSLGEADVKLDDGRLVYFRLNGEQVELVTSAADGAALQQLARFPTGSYYWHPRWSPDGNFVAFQRGDGVRFDVFVVRTGGGAVRQVTDDNTLISGLSWLPDGRRLVYSSSRGSTMPYLPTFTLWEVAVDDPRPRRLTSQELSYVHPDVHRDGRIVVGRMRMAFDVWKFPVDGSPIENVRRAVQVTRQTGHVQTPTSGPGTEVAYLSDSGGHANIWVLTEGTSEERQVTHERDAAVAVGVPLWSPDGRSIAYVSSRGNPGLGFGIWVVNPDGGHLRQLVAQGFGAAWSADGSWLYYVERVTGALKKVPADGGTPVTVRSEGARNAIGHDGSTLFYLDERPLVDGTPEFLIKAATPEDQEPEVIARVPASRVPTWQILNPALSPDGRWLAQALTDGLTTNIWVHPTAPGEWRQVTDFGDRVTFIARRVDWSRDGRFILAAVGEGDADIVLLEGLAGNRP
jgi:eukaryotic-like serine/threonine-protein kinase